MVSQLLSLERNTARGGKDSIDHGRGGHDDVANTAAGALVLATAPRPQHRMCTYQHYATPGRSHARPPERPHLRVVRITEKEDLKRRGFSE